MKNTSKATATLHTVYASPQNEARTIILNSETSFANQIQDPYRTYEVQENFEIGEVLLPVGCTLIFTGGKLINGTLIGNNTKIIADYPILSNVIMKGTYDMEYITDDIFAEYNKQTLQNISQMINDTEQVIEVNHDYLNISLTNNETILLVKSNSTLRFAGTISVNTNARQYSIIKIDFGTSNVVIDGGNFIGDAETNTSDGEWGFGISIYGATNIEIKKCAIRKMFGDGIYLGGYVTSGDEQNSLDHPANYNVNIHDCDIDSNRRLGIAIIEGTNINIHNNYIRNTGTINGTNPQYGIDIEPNYVYQTCDEININNNTFANNTKGSLTINAAGTLVGNVYFEDNLSNQEIHISTIGNVYIKNCKVDVLSIRGFCNNVTIENVNITRCLFISTANYENHQMNSITLNRCHLEQAQEYDLSYYKALIQYHTGSVRVNEITFNDCIINRLNDSYAPFYKSEETCILKQQYNRCIFNYVNSRFDFYANANACIFRGGHVRLFAKNASNHIEFINNIIDCNVDNYALVLGGINVYTNSYSFIVRNNIIRNTNQRFEIRPVASLDRNKSYISGNILHHMDSISLQNILDFNEPNPSIIHGYTLVPTTI